jgi:glyoxylase-like metal-dependent hydrolase (beta-lactamase superfamily II)
MSKLGFTILNCATFRPYFPRVVSTTNCLLVRSANTCLLVDTGLGVKDRVEPTRLVKWFCKLSRIPFDPEETAVHQIQALGLKPSDVKHILLTHLHVDHAGGLPDFPEAKVHVYKPEYEAAMDASGLGRIVYLPEHWSHEPHWVLHGLNSKKGWFGFDSIPVLADELFEVLFIPLVGHTAGHCGVAIKGGSKWVLHCGDALPFDGLEADPPEWITRRLIGPHVKRLKHLAQEHPDEIRLVVSHMPLDPKTPPNWYI